LLVLAGRSATGEVRFRMPGLVRDYGRSQLAMHPHGEVILARHAAHFARFGQEQAAQERTAREGEALAALEIEEDNLRAALTWCHANATGGAPGVAPA